MFLHLEKSLWILMTDRRYRLRDREKIIWIVVLLSLTSSVRGIFKRKTFYQAEENDNVTIRWDVHTKTDMSLTNLVCVFQSDIQKGFYQMINGAEVPESQHQQFAGRVHCDRDGLREGQIRLHVSGITAEDSGRYWCDLAVNYDRTMNRWVLRASEMFVLNVSRTSGGDNAPKTEPPSHGGSRNPKGNPVKEQVFLAVFILFQTVTVVAAFVKLLKTPQRKDQNQDETCGTESSTVQQRDEVNVDIPDHSSRE
ncbi:uncharacterized protein LOC108891067 [Lates calcarifer]|uniref:Uncharacterized protein LOC108891067 n=1 Tax=Lates calcarifer TaxID=8187 RepID=A0AAJ7Q0U8_LATCA|nr:uncharacterized protein LOC108891067 [Lates calcarifer]XP_018543709.1 uncharacterized protein LOC108891067 [Lates calcarifer]